MYWFGLTTKLHYFLFMNLIGIFRVECLAIDVNPWTVMSYFRFPLEVRKIQKPIDACDEFWNNLFLEGCERSWAVLRSFLALHSGILTGSGVYIGYQRSNLDQTHARQ